MARKPLPLLSLVMVTVLLLYPEYVPRRELWTLEQTTGREGDSSSDNRVGVREWFSLSYSKEIKMRTSILVF